MNRYWEERYKSGGTSGRGSTGFIRIWKWWQIKRHTKRLNNVVDVGCGDLSFWKNQHAINYTGIDQSQTIIEKNKDLYPS